MRAPVLRIPFICICAIGSLPAAAQITATPEEFDAARNQLRSEMQARQAAPDTGNAGAIPGWMLPAGPAGVLVAPTSLLQPPLPPESSPTAVAQVPEEEPRKTETLKRKKPASASRRQAKLKTGRASARSDDRRSGQKARASSALVLPESLKPEAAAESPPPAAKLKGKPGTPIPIATACQRAVASAARRYSARVVEVASGGATSAMPEGGTIAPVVIRITYGEGKNAKIREAAISCTLDPNGQVTALS